MKFMLFLLLPLYSLPAFSQLSYQPNIIEDIDIKKNEYRSLIAYKLPFRGENYKFYGTLSYHFYGRAFAGCKVHNTIVEAYHFSEQQCKDVSFKIHRTSSRRAGKLIPRNKRKNGNYVSFMTPLLKKEKPLKHYYRTGLLRIFIRYDKTGISKSNKDIIIDFESMAQYIINLDNASKMYGVRIKKIIFNRFLLDDLYAGPSGAELKSRDIYFAKYLSYKVNRKYDDLFYVEFAEKK